MGYDHSISMSSEVINTCKIQIRYACFGSFEYLVCQFCSSFKMSCCSYITKCDYFVVNFGLECGHFINDCSLEILGVKDRLYDCYLEMLGLRKYSLWEWGVLGCLSFLSLNVSEYQSLDGYC